MAYTGHYYGYYSDAHAGRYGAKLYLSENGKEVIVTCTSITQEAEEYTWPDKVYIGVVTKWVKDIGGNAIGGWP